MKKWLFFAVIIFLISSIPLSAEDDPVLAKIGNNKIKLSDLERVIPYYEAGRQTREDNPQHKAKLLKMYIEGEVISALAIKKGFDKRENIAEQIKLLTKNFLANAYIKNEIIDKIDVTEDDMKTYFKTHQEELKNPELLRARHILVMVNLKTSSDEDKARAKRKVDDLLIRIKAGEDFAKLAAEFSDDKASGKKGGDLGFFQRGRMLPEFDKAAFSLKPGELSDIVETPFGYHIIRVDEKKDAFIEPFDKLRDKIKERVITDFKKSRIEDFFSKVFKDADVEFYPEALYPKK